MEVGVANKGAPPLLLNNSGGGGNHFLNFKLLGNKSNRDAMGARIRVVTGSLAQIREIAGGGSYLFPRDFCGHLRIGQGPDAGRVVVMWPSRQAQGFCDV